MNAPRLEVDLAAVRHNARVLVDRLTPRGIRVTGVTKAVLGATGVAEAMRSGGVSAFGDSRVENLARLRDAGVEVPLTLIRSPMLSQVDSVVRHAAMSLNTEATVLDGLAHAARRQHRDHAVVLMVELGDLREGIAVSDVVDAARSVESRSGLTLAGLGTNLACQNGIVPDQTKMEELSQLAKDVESACGIELSIVSGGNSASLDWALSTADVGRIDELRLGESILLGTDPLTRQPIDRLRTDAFTLVAEVIEVAIKPSVPWGDVGQAAFGAPPPRRTAGSIRQALIAVGRQDVDPDGLTPPDGTAVLGASSDHLVLDVGDVEVEVGDDLRFQLGYSALVRAATSPFVHLVEHDGGPNDVSRPGTGG